MRKHGIAYIAEATGVVFLGIGWLMTGSPRLLLATTLCLALIATEAEIDG